MLWDAVPRPIDVNNPIILSGVWAGIFQWSFQSNKFFPQTDRNYPTLYFCLLNFSHKLTGIIQHYILFTEFFPQTDGNYPTLYFVHQIFSHKRTWFFPQTDMIFPTNQHEFFKNFVLIWIWTCNPLHQRIPFYPLSHCITYQYTEKKHLNFRVWWRL